VKGAVNITYLDEDELVQAIGTVGPVSIAFQVASDFRFYDGGVYDSKICKSAPNNVNHAVLAVGYGYDTESGLDFYSVKNSWGTDWGLDGVGTRHEGWCIGITDPLTCVHLSLSFASQVFPH